MDYSFYWAVLMAMEMDLFIGSWATLKAFLNPSAPSIISIIILIFLLLNFLAFGIIVGRGFFFYYLPKSKLLIS